MILDRNLGEVLPSGAIFLEIGGRGEREPSGWRLGKVSNAVDDDGRTGHATVFGFVVANDQNRVIEARGDRQDAEPNQVGSGGAVVRCESDGLVEELQGVGAFVRALVRVDRAGEDRIDLFLGLVDARIRIGFVRRVDDHVRWRLVPVLTELTTADSDDRDLVAYRFLVRHESKSPVASAKRASECPSSSNWVDHRIHEFVGTRTRFPGRSACPSWQFRRPADGFGRHRRP